MSSPQPDTTPGGPTPPQPPAYEPAPARPSTATNPFVGVPAADFVRDGAALLLLLMSLSARWDYTFEAVGRIEVVLITIISVLSLGVPYLARAGVFGQVWPTHRIRSVRLLANVPYFVMAFVFLVLDLVVGGSWGSAGGVGVALGLGLAGAILAAQARESELVDGPQGPVAGPWYPVMLALGALAVAGALLSFALTVIHRGDLLDARVLVIGFLITLGIVVLVAGPVLGTALRRASWRLVLLAVGGTMVLSYLLADAGRIGEAPVQGVHYAGFGLVLLAAAAAAAAAPSVRRAMRDAGQEAVWLGAAKNLVLLAVSLGAIEIVYLLLRLGDPGPKGGVVGVLLLTVLYVGAATVLLVMLREDGTTARTLAYVGAAALALLGLITLVVSANQWNLVIGHVNLVLALTVPVGIAALVSVPLLRGSSRRLAQGGPTATLPEQPTGAEPEQSPPAVPEQSPPAAPEQPTAGVSMPPPPPPPPPSVPESVRIAGDPTTTAATLAELAASAPEARTQIARHPNAYPELLAWLSRLGDPEVDRALQERGD